MKKQKYIVFVDGSINIFDCGEIHAYMVNGKKAVSAGFVLLDEDNFPIEIYGESTTLGIKSREKDLQILRNFLTPKRER